MKYLKKLSLLSIIIFTSVIITFCVLIYVVFNSDYWPSDNAFAVGEGLGEMSWPQSIAEITSGASPDAECDPGDIHLDLDETDDSVCPTDSDNSLCVCTSENTWVAIENRKPTYGEMLQDADPGACNLVTIGATDVFVMVDGFSAGPLSNMSFGSDLLTISTGKTGIYYATASLSFEGSANSVYEFCLSVDGVENMGCCSNRKTANNDVGTVGFNCIVQLSEDDEVGIEVADHDNTPQDPSICDGQVSLFRLRQ